MADDRLNLKQQESLSERELRFIVGRERELAEFEGMLDLLRRGAGPWMLHLHGTGGVGKTTFLRLCRHKAQQAGVRFIQLDSRDFSHTESGIGIALLSQIGLAAGAEEDALRLFAEQAFQWSRESGIVLAIDTYEEMQDMENWLRERLIPMLPARLLLVTAGRYSLRGGCLLSPVWRERIRQLPIAQLNRKTCAEYLAMCGITGAAHVERIWRRTGGHPLALSLAAASQALPADVSLSNGADWFGELASLWLQEVPDKALIRYVEAASVLRVFDQEKLEVVLEEELPFHVFDRLIALSFVRRTDRGWQMHDLMRDSMAVRLKERMPGRYQLLRERCAAFYANAILNCKERTAMEWEVGELFRYAEVDVLRALTADDNRRYYWEAVSDTTLRDALAYAAWRENHTQPVSGVEIDPVTGRSFTIEYSAEQVRFNAAPLDLEELYKLEPSSIKLLRDENDNACGLAICIPFHVGTMTWLQADPLCSPFLRTLTEDERLKLASPREQPAGWFLRSFDFADVLNPSIRMAGIRLIYSFLCRGGISVCSPYDSEIGRSAYTAFGFSPVEGATHCHYDGCTPTPTYALDTRGDKLPAFINKLFRQAGMKVKLEGRPPANDGSDDFPLLEQLSDRERQVAQEVVAGYSNAEIAARLHVSESTVKKHLKTIYAKFGINKRTQLSAKLLVRP